VFADLIGCKSLLAKLRRSEATIKASQALGKDPLDSFELNFTFVGAPGESEAADVLRACHPGITTSQPGEHRRCC